MKTRSRFIVGAVTVIVLLALFNTGCTLPVCTTPEITVTRTDDVAGGICTAENCTLRQAILASNACSGTQTVIIPTGTYSLTRTGAGEDASAAGDLDITDSIRIIGEGMPVIDGDASDRVFDILPGATVEMSGLVIQNGQYVDGGASREGGGISNRGHLTATNLFIRNNNGREHGNGGGGLYNSSGATASISHSAIVGNYSDEGAGGILNIGTMTLDNVTISGNDAYGIFTVGPLDISYSTIASNLVVQIWVGAGGETPVVNNSIVEGFPGAEGCLRLEPLAGAFNIEYNAPGDRTCSFTGPNNLTDVDPLLSPLSAYDGTMLPIHALDPASPAVDSADPSNCSGTDQRGVARPQGSACDRGAYELDENLISIPVIPPLATEPPIEPPELISFILNVGVPANCRQGPATIYGVVNSVLPGEKVQVLGRNVEGTWWYSQVDNDKCWISNVAGTPSGDPNQLPIIQPPPLPSATEEEPAEEQPTEQTELDFDQDGYGVSLDCNDKDPNINPGAAETPDDKVDSNCNGDDDK